MTARQAAGLIQDGMTLGINSFLALGNPDGLHKAIAERFDREGSPRNLRLFCCAGYGGWEEDLFAERFVRLGAVERVVASHYGSMPETSRLVRENRLEAYCMPLGALINALRAAAAGRGGYLGKTGLGLFVDPRVDGPGMNGRSRAELVRAVELLGEEYLYYYAPKIDVALIKGSSVDPGGNITFENECVTADALTLAQAARANGGKVLVQVDRVVPDLACPRSVVLPHMLVDAVVVQTETPADPRMTVGGPRALPSSWGDLLQSGGARNLSHEIIARRAAQELSAGQIVNIGVGIPELVGKRSAELGLKVSLTVESGGMGGVPAPGRRFGATIGADAIYDMGYQLDFYHGGGLDVCFMGGLEVDARGNVNAHRLEDRFVGIGGFADITQNTRSIVFCLNFAAKGLELQEQDGRLSIRAEGTVPKFRREIAGISFSAENARRSGQNVWYVTERCVFRLGGDGLELIEVYPGVDKERDILERLDFPVRDCCGSTEKEPNA